jgi:hypothetical protein
VYIWGRQATGSHIEFAIPETKRSSKAFILLVLAPDMKHTNHFEYFRDFGIQRRIREYIM